MNLEANKKTDSGKTYPVIVKKNKSGLYEWAIPTMGALNSYSLSYVDEFMATRGLSYEVRNVTSTENLN